LFIEGAIKTAKIFNQDRYSSPADNVTEGSVADYLAQYVPSTSLVI